MVTADFAKFADEIKSSIPSEPEMISSKGKSGVITITVVDERIIIQVLDAGSVVTANRLVDDSGNPKKFEVGM